jgi:hypothetical protein
VSDDPVILVLLEGAAEVPGDRPTLLGSARTPALAALAETGAVVALAPPSGGGGAETSAPALLGLAGEPGRGVLEAAAVGVRVGHDEGAWRLDVRPPGRVPPDAALRLAEAVAPLGGVVHALGGHRHLLIGPRWWGDAPPGPHQTDATLAALARGPFAGVAKAAKAALRTSGAGLRAWPWGRLGGPPAVGSRQGHLLSTGGVVAGVGFLAGLRVGPMPGSPAALAAVVGAALVDDTATVIVHDGRLHDLGHAGLEGTRRTALEEHDALVGALVEVAAARGARLLWCTDHAADPESGRHAAVPLPAVRWRPGGPASGPAAATERAVAHLPPVDPADLSGGERGMRRPRTSAAPGAGTETGR